MRKILLFTFLLTVCNLYSKVTLPSLITDGMVLQRNQINIIWGKSSPNEKIVIKFNNRSFYTNADEEGNWEVKLSPFHAGGPYTMVINDIYLEDILIGDVFLFSGQSNMELNISRVMDKYANEVSGYSNNFIRYVKVPYCYNFQEEQSDIDPISWKPLQDDNIMTCSALCYFFSRLLYEKNNIPIGIVNSSWGGSTIEAWIGKNGLKNFDSYLNRASIYANDSLVDLIKLTEKKHQDVWSSQLYKTDKGINSNILWYSEDLNDETWDEVDLFSNDWSLKDNRPVNGVHWFRKKFNLPDLDDDKSVTLRLGCIVDADSVFVNGVFVGSTSYQYPPRIYQIPKGILKKNNNLITIRLISYSGYPGFIKEKPYKLIYNDCHELLLIDKWKHKVGTSMPSFPYGIGFNCVSTGLYNGMIYPLKNLKFKGVVWYQGESNVGRWNEYSELLSSLISEWRSLFKNNDLPFYIIELADFMKDDDKNKQSWIKLCEQQYHAAKTNYNTFFIKNRDTGEWNDIHPLDKKTAAIRLVDMIVQ